MSLLQQALIYIEKELYESKVILSPEHEKIRQTLIKEKKERQAKLPKRFQPSALMCVEQFIGSSLIWAGFYLFSRPHRAIQRKHLSGLIVLPMSPASSAKTIETLVPRCMEILCAERPFQLGKLAFGIFTGGSIWRHVTGILLMVGNRPLCQAWIPNRSTLSRIH